jgi:hypothetical protein
LRLNRSREGGALAEHLPSNHEALGSSPALRNKKKQTKHRMLENDLKKKKSRAGKWLETVGKRGFQCFRVDWEGFVKGCE